MCVCACHSVCVCMCVCVCVYACVCVLGRYIVYTMYNCGKVHFVYDNNVPMYSCVCVCVCVCGGERAGRLYMLFLCVQVHEHVHHALLHSDLCFRNFLFTFFMTLQM